MKFIKKALKYLAIVATGLVAIFLILVWWISPLAPFMDDGPFYGEEANENEIGSLKQDFPIHNGMRLLVYLNKDENKPPIVQLKNNDGSVRWSILPTGHKETTVSDIEFKDYNCTSILLACNVSGYVTWTYGKERMSWHIYKWGGLRGYYYSW